MAGIHGTSGSYYTLAEHELQRQRSTPAAAFAPCRAACGDRSSGNLRNSDGYRDEFRDQLVATTTAARTRSAGGVGAVARALWAWVVKGRRRKVLARSGSSEQYGYEEYEQNFDEGAAMAEPENLARSFSARYAVATRRGRRAGLAEVVVTMERVSEGPVSGGVVVMARETPFTCQLE